MKTEKNKKRTEEKRADYKEKIRKLEKKVEKLEKRGEEEETGTVESVVGQLIPGLGGIVRALEKSSPEFRRRIAETDAEIEHRLETGWGAKPSVEYGISIRPLTERKAAAPKSVKTEEETGETEKREPIIDIFEEKNHILVIAEFPGVEEKDIETKLKDNTLEISTGKYCKTIRLPPVSKSILERTYKNGILQLKIKREDNAG
jgi:HSP20 family molecular chaperone IbpA